MADVSAGIIWDGKNQAWFTTNAAIVFDANITIYCSEAPNYGQYKYTDGVTALSALPWSAASGGGGQVDTVQGTTNRISVDATDPANPIVNISGAYDTAITNAISAAVSGKEDTSNKQTDLTPSATKYPTVNAVNDGLATILPAQPTFSGQWRGTVLTGLIASNGSGLVGTAFYTPYFVNKKHTVVAIRCYINTTVAFGYVRLALMHAGVNSDGLIGISTVLEESGNVNTPTANAFYQYNFITPLELTEQVYWMGFQVSGGHTAKFYAGGITPMFSGGALNVYSYIKVAQSFGAFTPSPAVQTVDTGTNRGIFMELLVQ